MTTALKVDEPQRRMIELACEVGAQLGVVPYLVGGPVRDLLLGENVVDLDLLVESKSEEFARELAHRCGAAVTAFPQFLTWKLVGSPLGAVDIATSRREAYAAPGALPAVDAAPLSEDLTRRDFSINAIAMSLADGSLVDPAGGREDIERRIIRVLHDRSFVDDPTRIYRAFRFAARFSFTLEERTAELLESAIRGGAMETVSRERLWRELFLAMNERHPADALAGIVRSGAAERLLPRAASRLPVARLVRLSGFLARVTGVDREAAFLSALLADVPEDLPSMESSPLSERRRRGVAANAMLLHHTVRELFGAANDAERYTICRSSSRELLAVVASEAPVVAGLVERFLSLTGQALQVRGDQLGVPPGPHVARALDRTRQAIFAGEIAVTDAASFAQRQALQYLHQKPGS